MQIKLRMFLVHCFRGEKMGAYSEAYLGDVVENQGKLFDFVAQSYPDSDTEDFINTYMKSKTRKTLTMRWLMLIPWMQKNCGNTFQTQKNIS